MIVGYILIATFAGLIASIVAIVLGASFWFAFGLYVFVGSAVLILLPIGQMVAGILVGRAKIQTTTDDRDELGNSHQSESTTDQQGTIVETSMRILAVDDDPFILELIPVISAEAGFSQVTPAASGEQALTLLASSEAVFDCLLFDISMPGMDGIELCRRVRQIPQYRKTPIVMLTAMRDMTSMGDAYRAGATDYATKPFDIEELGTRLRLAQEAIYAGSTRQEGRGHHRSPVRSYSFELPEAIRLEGVGSFVDRTVLSNYLTQLPRKELTDVQVFAVSIDGIEAFHTRSSSQQFVSLLEDVAAAATDYFGADRTVMAYTDNATLLIAANSATPLLAINVEIEIERRLQGNVSEYDTDEGTRIGVSVGGPIQPQISKAERARMATDRVITLVENRTLDKQGRTVAGLFKR